MAVCAVVALHAAIVFGVPWPTAQVPAVTAPLAIVVVPQGNPTPSMQTPDPAEAVEVRPPSAASVDSMPAESEIVEKVDPAEQPRERPVEVTEAKPVETAAARAPDRVALAVAPPTRAERIDRREQAEARPERAVESATPPAPDVSEVRAADTPAQAPSAQMAAAEPSRASATLTESRETPPVDARQSARPVPAPLMQFNPAAAAVANDAPESKPEVVEAAPARPLERAGDRPAAAQAQPANPTSAQALPVRTEPQAAPAVERTGPVQQAMRTEPNQAMVRDRPDRGDPTIANDNKPAKEKQEKKKPKARSMASTASSASSPSRHSAVASVSGAVGSANYRALVMAELNRRKFYPSGAREQRGVVVVTFAIGSSGGVTSFSITRSSGVSALDGAVLQMMRSVSLPPPPGGSFRATVPVHFDLPR